MNSMQNSIKSPFTQEALHQLERNTHYWQEGTRLSKRELLNGLLVKNITDGRIIARNELNWWSKISYFIDDFSSSCAGFVFNRFFSSTNSVYRDHKEWKYKRFGYALLQLWNNNLQNSLIEKTSKAYCNTFNTDRRDNIHQQMQQHICKQLLFHLKLPPLFKPYCNFDNHSSWDIKKTVCPKFEISSKENPSFGTYVVHGHRLNDNSDCCITVNCLSSKSNTYWIRSEAISFDVKMNNNMTFSVVKSDRIAFLGTDTYSIKEEKQFASVEEFLLHIKKKNLKLYEEMKKRKEKSEIPDFEFIWNSHTCGIKTS